MVAFLSTISLFFLLFCAIKLLFFETRNKLNIFLGLLSLLTVPLAIIEIILFFSKDAIEANKLYTFYQIFSFFPVVLYILSILEYIHIHTNISNKKLVSFIEKSAIISHAFIIIYLFINGASGKIFLSAPGKWCIDFAHLQTMFYVHTYISMIWLIVSVFLLIYTSNHLDNSKKKTGIIVLTILQTLVFISVIYYILYQIKSEVSQYDIISSFPITIIIVMQTFVLSNFKIFEIKSKNIYQEVFDVINNWVIILDEYGKIRFMNKVIGKELGISSVSLFSKNIDDFIYIDKNNKKNCVEYNMMHKSVGNNYIEMVIRNKKNEQIYNMQSTFKEVIIQQQKLYLWVLLDTTKIETLKSKNEIIENKSKTLSKIYNDAIYLMQLTSHDIIAPLKTIKELTILANEELEKTGQNKISEYLKYIKSISSQSIIMASQIVEFLRINSDVRKQEWVSIESTIINIRERFVIDILKTNALITFSGLDKIFVDIHHVTELLANFIQNSIKYKSEEHPKININIAEDEKEYKFWYTDNGIGIPFDFTDKLFGKYSRVENTKVKGTGIGLYLCKKIIENNDGVINVNNNLDKGVTIYFTLAKKVVQNFTLN